MAARQPAAQRHRLGDGEDRRMVVAAMRDAEPIEPGEVYEYPIEIWPICNVFKPGHRLRLEIANADSIVAGRGRRHVTLPVQATNTICEGGRHPSRLIVPLIPR